jgi:hypothetical protein
LFDRHFRKKRVGLKNHADAALARRKIRHVFAVQDHAAGVRRFEPGDDSQNRRLAEPEAPSSTSDSPSATSKLMSSSTVAAPNLLLMFRRSRQFVFLLSLHNLTITISIHFFI